MRAAQKTSYALLFLLCLSLHSVQAQQFPTTAYPDTRRVDHMDTYHGVQVADPYRWLEALDTDEVQAWVEAQDTLARRMMAPLPGREAIRARLEAIAPKALQYPPQKRGDTYIFAKIERTEDGRRQGLFIQEGKHGTPRLLVDLDAFGGDARLATYSGSGVPSFRVSPDGRYVAYGIRQGSSSWSRWYVHDVQTNQRLPDVLEGLHHTRATVRWRRDAPGFFYTAYDLPADPDAPQQGALTHHTVYYHRLGDAQEEDEQVFASPGEPLATYNAQVSSDGRYLVLQGNEGDRYWVYYKDLHDPESPIIPLALDIPSWFSLVGNDGPRLWFVTRAGAPRGRLIEVDATQPEEAHWKEILSEDETATLNGADYLGGRFLVYYTRDAIPAVQIHARDGTFAHAVALPYIGWVRSGFEGQPDDPVVSFTLQGTGEPDTVYLLDMETGTTSVFRASDEAFDRDAYYSEQVFFHSKDGTRVPMTLIYKKGLRKDGTNPTWLYAYGTNWAAVPWYARQFRVWLEMGGVYALANVRGGSEYGEAWRDAGSGVNKQNGIDDYLAAATWLIDEGYTAANKLVANGGSASGPLAAAALLQRPDLFAAAAIDYPVLDLLRFHQFAAGSLAGNWGTAEDPDAFTALRAWSPYHNTTAGVCYPPTIIAQGSEDSVASPLHSYKFAAALQAAQGCAHPVLLQVGWGFGHTVGGTDEVANQLAFLAYVTGLKVPGAWAATR